MTQRTAPGPGVEPEAARARERRRGQTAQAVAATMMLGASKGLFFFFFPSQSSTWYVRRDATREASCRGAGSAGRWGRGRGGEAEGARPRASRRGHISPPPPPPIAPPRCLDHPVRLIADATPPRRPASLCFVERPDKRQQAPRGKAPLPGVAHGAMGGSLRSSTREPTLAPPWHLAPAPSGEATASAARTDATRHWPGPCGRLVSATGNAHRQ